MWQTLSRAGAVVVVSDDQDDAGVWAYAMNVGADLIVILPDGRAWADEHLHPDWKAPLQ